MNWLHRIGPYAYAALHSYNSVWQLALTRSESRTAQRDREALHSSFPFLADYVRLSQPFRERFARDYQEYTSTISSKPIALSFELAVFLAVLCQQLRPGAILDLGSGFSSYVFRSYARDGAVPNPVVLSIDTSASWLEETRRYLQDRRVDTGGLQTWDAYVGSEKPRFDLVLQDIADLGTRLHMLDGILAACRPGALIVIDDMHVPGYRRALLAALRRRGLTYFSLRSFTRKRLRYAYLVVT